MKLYALIIQQSSFEFCGVSCVHGLNFHCPKMKLIHFFFEAYIDLLENFRHH